MRDAVLISLLVIVGLFISTPVLAGEFDLKLEGAHRVNNYTFFKVGLDNIDNKEEISHWKVRFNCEEAMAIKINAATESVCGRALDYRTEDLGSFYFMFMNYGVGIKKFSFKVKSYNKQGDWLNTEKKSFSWY